MSVDASEGNYQTVARATSVTSPREANAGAACRARFEPGSIRGPLRTSPDGRRSHRERPSRPLAQDVVNYFFWVRHILERTPARRRQGANQETVTGLPNKAPTEYRFGVAQAGEIVRALQLGL